MKKLPIFLLICLLIGIVACKETEDYWTQYEQWRETNESWFIEQLGAKDEKGNPIYTKVVPSWDHSIYVLMTTTIRASTEMPNRLTKPVR